jgi:hypothetical protein
MESVPKADSEVKLQPVSRRCRDISLQARDGLVNGPMRPRIRAIPGLLEGRDREPITCRGKKVDHPKGVVAPSPQERPEQRASNEAMWLP